MRARHSRLCSKAYPSRPRSNMETPANGAMDSGPDSILPSMDISTYFDLLSFETGCHRLQKSEGDTMAQSFRVFYAQLSGRTPFNVNLDGFNITRQSAILVTAAPCSFSGQGGFFDQDMRLNVHGPDVRVSNVVPHGPEGAAGGVEFVLTLDAPTDVAVTITVLDPWDLVGGWTRGN